jgi:hypothetical protein
MPKTKYNEKYNIFINECRYLELAKALIERCSKIQLDDISFIAPVDDKVYIPFLQLIKQFEYCGQTTFGDEEFGEYNCICGRPIKYCHEIKNKYDDTIHVVGSKCCEHWDPYYVDNDVIYRCLFCRRKKSNGENCKNCKGRKIIKKICDKFKSNLEKNRLKERQKFLEEMEKKRQINTMKKDIIKFGKHKGMSFYDLLTTEVEYSNYILRNFDNSTERNIEIKNKITNYRKFI